MNLVFLFLMPLVAVAAIMLPLFVSLKRIHDKKPVNRKRAVITNVVSFFGVMIVMTLLPITGAVAASTDPGDLQRTEVHRRGAFDRSRNDRHGRCRRRRGSRGDRRCFRE